MIKFSTIKQYLRPCLAVTSASLAIIPCGMEYSWTSPAIQVLFSNNTPINPFPDPETKMDTSYWISTIFLVGAIVGVVQTFLLLTFFGRRKTILIDTLIGLICWIIIGVTSQLEIIYVMRFIQGLAENGMYVTIPMYNAECSQPEIRGLLGCIIRICSMFGMIAAYSIIPFVPIWASSSLPVCLNIITLTTFFFQPETPYYLLKKSQLKEAEKSLQYFRSKTDVSEELTKISLAVSRQESEKGKPWDLIRIRSNRKATLYMLLLSSTQNMAGLSVITMNAHYLLQEAANLSETEPSIPEEWSAIIFSVVMLVGLIVGAVLVDKYGRKILVISSGICTAVFLIILTLYYSIPNIFISINLTWLPLFALIGYAFAFNWGIGPVPGIINGELFSSSIKVTGMIVSDIYFTVIAALTLQIYYLTLESLGLYVPFLIFGVYTTVAVILIWVFVPETKRKTLEEIQMILKK